MYGNRMYGCGVKHKVFISYYHHDDQKYKDYIDFFLSSNIINKSVCYGEYDSDNSAEYIKRLIREEKISDSSVVIVLVGPNTKFRKHVDWEIYAGLHGGINGCSGLVGILLPELRHYNGLPYIDDIPGRLADNVQSGYADLYEWGYAVNNFNMIVENAFNKRIVAKNKVNNTRIQMKRNL